MHESARQSVLFPGLLSKPVEVVFDEPATTSDGGSVLLAAADQCLGLTRRLESVLDDQRQGSKVEHPFLDLLRQRIYGLGCGYADANDAARLGRDPLLKLLLDRDPLSGRDLASQSTISRFENGRPRRELYGLGVALLDAVLDRHRRRLRRGVKHVTIDLDVTDDPTHGAQQLSLFNGYYDTWCYLPLLGFVSFDAEPEQYLVAALLRPGTAPTAQGAVGLLRRIIREVRVRFPAVAIRVRLDGGFAGPELLTFLDEARVEYVVGMPGNAVLFRRSRRLLGTARRRRREEGRTVALYGETRYAARTWRRQKRRVVYKAEVVTLDDREPRDNVRYVVTNSADEPAAVYGTYCQRGEIENRIKELKHEVALGRTSCGSFWANQLRVLLSAAAYVLLQELRARATRIRHVRMDVGTLRLRLLKIGGRVVRSARRVVIHLAASHPWQNLWHALARAWAPAPT